MRRRGASPADEPPKDADDAKEKRPGGQGASRHDTPYRQKLRRQVMDDSFKQMIAQLVGLVIVFAGMLALNKLGWL